MDRLALLNVHQHLFPSFGLKVHTAQYQPTDRPIEDRISVSEAHDRVVIGVYDGHRGPWAADYVAGQLPNRFLETDPAVEATQAFEELDREMMQDFCWRAEVSLSQTPAAGWQKFMRRPFSSRSTTHPEDTGYSLDSDMSARRILSGTTALLAVFALGQAPRVYNTGDSRGFVYDATRGVMIVTNDHNAHSSHERARIHQEHPNEPYIFTGNRLFGQQLATRSFGDGHYKLTLDKHRAYVNVMSRYAQAGTVQMHQMYDTLFHDYLTPPYVTARPDKVQHIPPDFVMSSHPSNMLVLATDGLWDVASPEDVRDMVEKAITEGALQEETNLVELLSNKLVRDTGARFGDDVSVIIALGSVPA